MRRIKSHVSTQMTNTAASAHVITFPNMSQTFVVAKHKYVFMVNPPTDQMVLTLNNG
jgi:hypothetical protein